MAKKNDKEIKKIKVFERVLKNTKNGVISELAPVEFTDLNTVIQELKNKGVYFEVIDEVKKCKTLYTKLF